MAVLAHPQPHQRSPRPPAPAKPSLALWMERVLIEADRAAADFAADPVHDLRVALRRVRSLADGMIALDPEPAWKQMKRAGKAVFQSLGELRDVQVMEEWVGKVGAADDVVTLRLRQYFESRQPPLKRLAADALAAFDRKQWKKWAVQLPRRVAGVKPGSVMLKHLALERWTAAHELHRRAVRNRSAVSLHNLRIGIKRFRYIVENFLPEEHAAWGGELKQLQDLLGDIHDLDVLWATALQVHAFPSVESRSQWRARILEQRELRLQKYRSEMLGKESLWHTWRNDLPHDEAVSDAALARLKYWASRTDPDVQHSALVARLAQQLYGGLPHRTGSEGGDPRERMILEVAAIMHEIGRAEKAHDHHKRTYRKLAKLVPPLGWSREDLRMCGIIARYHRGALPRAGQATLSGLDAAQRQEVFRLAGILRLANAFDDAHDGHIQRLEVSQQDGHIVVAAQGYSPRDRAAERVAAARHLLETAYRKPVIIKPLRARPGASSTTQTKVAPLRM